MKSAYTLVKLQIKLPGNLQIKMEGDRTFLLNYNFRSHFRKSANAIKFHVGLPKLVKFKYNILESVSSIFSRLYLRIQRSTVTLP
jgi:hypothetical protein